MGRRARSGIALFSAFVAAAACGGVVSSEGSGDASPIPPTSNPAETGGVTGAGGKASSGPSSGTVALPACSLGFVKGTSSSPCVFAFDSRCYGTKLDACACACPSRAGTTCISGFPEASGETIVACN
jgi:hypothetical protein